MPSLMAPSTSAEHIWNDHFHKLSDGEGGTYVVYAIFIDGKPFYVGLSGEYNSRKIQHVREIMNQFFLRYITPKAAKLLGSLVSEISSAGFDEPFARLPNGNRKHLAFLKIKEDMCRAEAVALEAEIIHYYGDDLTNIRTETHNRCPYLDERVKCAYARKKFESACKSAKNPTNPDLESLNFWAYIRRPVFRPTNNPSEYEAIASWLRRNGFFQQRSNYGAPNHFAENEKDITGRYVDQLHRLLMEGTFRKMAEEFGPELERMCTLREPVELNKFAENPIFHLYAKLFSKKVKLSTQITQRHLKRRLNNSYASGSEEVVYCCSSDSESDEVQVVDENYNCHVSASLETTSRVSSLKSSLECAKENLAEEPEGKRMKFDDEWEVEEKSGSEADCPAVQITEGLFITFRVPYVFHIHPSVSGGQLRAKLASKIRAEGGKISRALDATVTHVIVDKMMSADEVDKLAAWNKDAKNWLGIFVPPKWIDEAIRERNKYLVGIQLHSLLINPASI